MLETTRPPRIATGLACLGLALGALACKSKDEAAAPATEVTAKAAAARPSHTVFAASAHVRVVDTGASKVVGRVQLQKAVREIRFSPDGATAYVAASDGVRAIDARTHAVLAHLTERPARSIELSADGTTLYVLEHWVKIDEAGRRFPQPFSLVTLDTRTGQVGAREVVGERILYAREAPEGGRRVLVTEAGEIRLAAAGEAWSEGEPVDPTEGLPPSSPYRVRNTFAHHGDVVFVPVEGSPARVLEIDTKRGATRFVSLGVEAVIRGLGVTPDGATLLVSTGNALHFLDRASGRALGEPLPLEGNHVGCAVSDDGRYAFLAKTIDGTGGAVAVIDVKARRLLETIHLDDISPWAIAVAPTVKVAAR